jgi:hypothetical protein
VLQRRGLEVFNEVEELPGFVATDLYTEKRLPTLAPLQLPLGGFRGNPLKNPYWQSLPRASHRSQLAAFAICDYPTRTCL